MPKRQQLRGRFQRQDIERSPEQVCHTLTNRHRHHIVCKLEKAAFPLTLMYMYSQFQLDHVTRYSNAPRAYTVVATNKTPLAKRRRTQRFLRSSARTHALATFIDLISFTLRTGQGQQVDLRYYGFRLANIMLLQSLIVLCFYARGLQSLCS